MFFECRSVMRRWATIAVYLMGTQMAIPFMKGTLGEFVYAEIMRALHNPMSMVIIIEIIASIFWRERNACNSVGRDRKFLSLGCLLWLKLMEEPLWTIVSGHKRQKWAEEISILNEAVNPSTFYMRTDV